MKRTFCFLTLVSFLPMFFSCEISEGDRNEHINHGYLSSYGKNMMEHSVIYSSETVADVLDIQTFLRLPDSEQNSDENYEMRSRIVSKDKAGELNVLNYGVILTSGGGIDVSGGEWRSEKWAIRCVGENHWTMAFLDGDSSSCLRSIEFAADIKRDASSPKTYMVAVSDGVAFDDEGAAMAMKFRTEKDFLMDRSADNADGVFFAEVVKDDSVLDWVRITAASRIGQGYRITVASSRQ